MTHCKTCSHNDIWHVNLHGRCCMKGRKGCEKKCEKFESMTKMIAEYMFKGRLVRRMEFEAPDEPGTTWSIPPADCPNDAVMIYPKEEV